jgi:hypothetical protein
LPDHHIARRCAIADCRGMVAAILIDLQDVAKVAFGSGVDRVDLFR